MKKRQIEKNNHAIHDSDITVNRVKKTALSDIFLQTLEKAKVFLKDRCEEHSENADQLLGGYALFSYTGCPKKNAPVKLTKMAKPGRLVNIPKGFKRARNGKHRCF